MNKEQYPVLEIIDELKEKLSSSSLVILQAPPGAGKSTVVPLHLLDEPWLAKKIVMLEPRRLAAKAVAERMSQLMDEETGQSVGYRVRFDSKTSARTRVEVVTEGILTRMMQTDTSLEDVSLIVFDEFHERSLHADLALALALQLQQVLRPELRILIMSATLDAAALSGLLGDAPVVTSKGRQFPVDLRYAGQDSDQPIVPRVVSAIRKACAEDEGDVLVFLPGAGEINRAEQLLADSPVNAVVYPLYGDMTFARQQEALLPRRDGMRKVVLATSIAETSLTIEGVRVVIDSGLSRVPRFDPRSGLTRLETIRVTKDSADQRAGRAGRLGPGVCYRMWTQGAQLSLVDQRKPEILEADLAALMLELYQWGTRDPFTLTWITPPPSGAVRQAMELLRNLEAIGDNNITDRGRKMLRLPTHPRIAHMLLVGEEEGIASVALATDIAALLEERDPLDRDAGADIALRIDALRKWRSRERVAADRSALERIERLAANWRRIMRVKEDNSTQPDSAIGKLLWAAYPERLAQQQSKHGNRYKLANGRMAVLPQHDALVREQWICAAQLDAGAGEGKIFLASAIHLDDLMDHATESVNVFWDDDRDMLVAAKEKRIGPLLLESRSAPGLASDEKRIDVICEKVRDTELRIFGQVEARLEFQSRVASLHHWRKEEGWPEFTDLALCDTVETWLSPFLTNVVRRSDLEKLDLPSILKASLPWELQRRVDELAPTRLEVPSGSQIKVQYSIHGASPIMEVRLQEMFGLADTPTVNEGRTKVTLHLLSPGFKPVQVTQDLRSFWETTYHEVRKELRMRYPRHHWPEDPWTAEAVRGARRRS